MCFGDVLACQKIFEESWLTRTVYHEGDQTVQILVNKFPNGLLHGSVHIVQICSGHGMGFSDEVCRWVVCLTEHEFAFKQRKGTLLLENIYNGSLVVGCKSYESSSALFRSLLLNPVLVMAFSSLRCTISLRSGREGIDTWSAKLFYGESGMREQRRAAHRKVLELKG